MSWRNHVVLAIYSFSKTWWNHACFFHKKRDETMHVFFTKTWWNHACFFHKNLMKPCMFFFHKNMMKPWIFSKNVMKSCCSCRWSRSHKLDGTCSISYCFIYRLVVPPLGNWHASGCMLTVWVVSSQIMGEMISSSQQSQFPFNLLWVDLDDSCQRLFLQKGLDFTDWFLKGISRNRGPVSQWVSKRYERQTM